MTFIMFFPYRARIALFHLPVLTILVCALCFAIFTAQYNSQRALHQSAVRFCEGENDGTFLRALKWLGGSAEPWLCAQLMLRLHHARDDKAQVSALAERHANPGVKAELAAHYEQALLDTYQTFRLQAPANLTARLWVPRRVVESTADSFRLGGAWVAGPISWATSSSLRLRRRSRF
jgi:hypothetical protein